MNHGMLGGFLFIASQEVSPFNPPMALCKSPRQETRECRELDVNASAQCLVRGCRLCQKGLALLAKCPIADSGSQQTLDLENRRVTFSVNLTSMWVISISPPGSVKICQG